MGEPRLVSVSQLLELYPAIKPRTLRYWIQNAAERDVSENGSRRTLPGNGLGRAVIRKGRVTLIDVDAFNAWLYEGRLSA